MFSASSTAVLLAPKNSLGVPSFQGLAGAKCFTASPKAVVFRAASSRRTAARKLIVADSDYRRDSGGGGFFPGFILGGVVFGALGYLFAPQISKAILGTNEEGSSPKLPKWISESDNLEEKRRKMNEKLAELNRAIDKTSAELKGSDFAEAPTNRRTPNVDHIEAI
ncbi:hypothetical protein CLOM_g9380 [Closterium sp. NIES-68]|nr:hypothetical protein CLOM_g5304 [Closterium sp. NIES-68]GJP50240.1 hypothetical protein CLOM_g9380 [Closterium sp. NIES-68]GJP63941.1 hypothetical protein CLOP_g20969 [Closterium sp. NIES-67]GJP64086.1 hypothetical protein CLOP_g21115 [Closterium sp. NIES-67]